MAASLLSENCSRISQIFNRPDEMTSDDQILRSVIRLMTISGFRITVELKQMLKPNWSCDFDRYAANDSH